MTGLEDVVAVIVVVVAVELLDLDSTPDVLGFDWPSYFPYMYPIIATVVLSTTCVQVATCVFQSQPVGLCLLSF